ncbi:MAG: hypothetical protein WA093_03325 [Minisyncoccales bacterium]
MKYSTARERSSAGEFLVFAVAALAEKKLLDLLLKDFRSEIFRFRASRMKNEEAYLN